MAGDLLHRGAIRPERVGRVLLVGVAERDSDQHATVVIDAEVSTDERRMSSDRCLGYRIDTERTRGEKKIRDEDSSVHRTVDAQLARHGHDGDVRRIEELEIPRCLRCACPTVSMLHTDCVIELPSAGSSSVAVQTCVGLREGEVRLGRVSRVDVFLECRAESVGGCARRDLQLPRLSVAPRRGTLRERQYAVDHRLGDWRREKCTTASAILGERFEGDRLGELAHRSIHIIPIIEGEHAGTHDSRISRN